MPQWCSDAIVMNVVDGCSTNIFRDIKIILKAMKCKLRTRAN